MIRARYAAAALLSTLFGCAEDTPEPLVVLIAVDGATPEVISELRSRGKLPNIDRLIREGTWGPMESLAARRRLQARPRRGYWSPIVWASMATGKVPDKHGIVDFLLPVGESFAWAGRNDGPPESEIRLPELEGNPPHKLHARLRTYPPNGEQTVELSLNGHSLGSISIADDWADHVLEIPEGSARPAENRLALRFERQSRPFDNGKSNDHRALAGALASLSITDAEQRTVVTFDPIYGRFDLVRGFHQPEAKVVEAQSSHFRAKPVWDLLGESGHPVGIVGYWNTWPATAVNGFLVSSHMGVRGKRQETTSALTWPPELAADIESLEPDEASVTAITDDLWPEGCQPLERKSLQSFERILWQDAFYYRIARKLLPPMKRGFFTVYFESIDGSGHLFLPYRQGAALPPGCPESVREVVDGTYVQVDEWVGELLKELPGHATILLVSDHGLSSGGDRGFHAPFGVLVASGPGIRKGIETHGMSVLDVAPTILYVSGEAVPLDMDGKVLASLFEIERLEAHPPRYADVDTSMSSSATPDPEVSEEMLERLRALGYLQ